MIRKLLDIPIIYSTFQRSVKTFRYEAMLTQLLNSSTIKDQRVLDFGCGPGDLADRFLEADYLGIDPLLRCVKVAQAKVEKLKIKGKVKLGDHNSLLDLEPESFDLIIAIGVLHHMDDAAAQTFVQNASRLLTPKTGQLVTLDPCIFEEQSFASRFMVKRDRGRFVRHEIEYKKLLEVDYNQISSQQYSKILRMPYDLLSMTAMN